MTTETTNVVIQNTNKLLAIGNAWINDRDLDDASKPRMTIKLDRDLGLSITLGANAQLLCFANKKREGKQDADYRVAVSIPAEVADREIARQQAVAEERKATASSVIASPVAEVA